ncbi:MAG: outer membrane lipid asymmetry maintenance protein MlaD [Desulfobacteraceae bacterium]|nr:MAG: outer membrane lipid asymmetry maintenance protein MlaD [Desulfobacteraceae bacterium]
MKDKKKEFYVGLFIIIGMICVLYLFSRLGEIKLNNHTYPVTAYFTSVSGLKTGARIEMAGVHIGKVASIGLDKEKLVAKVQLQINQGIELSEDSIASVKTAGIIGEKYIEISPGGDDLILEPNDEIFNTESSLDIESLVRKFIFDKEKK